MSGSTFHRYGIGAYSCGVLCVLCDRLYAGGNEFAGGSAIPASIATLPLLHVLDLSANEQLTALPAALESQTRLDGAHGEGHYLSLEGCTNLVAPPYRVVAGKAYGESCYAEVRDWFALPSEQRVREAKAAKAAIPAQKFAQIQAAAARARRPRAGLR